MNNEKRKKKLSSGATKAVQISKPSEVYLTSFFS